MIERSFVERANTSDFVGRTDQGAAGPAVNSDPFPDHAPANVTLVHASPIGQAISHEPPLSLDIGSLAPLLNREVSEHLRTRWNEIQGRFVDEPRSAVQQADALVSEVVEHITQLFATEQSLLESQWKQGHDVSTEDLRKALQHYRSFFNRLVV